jgi:hypothetical protein
VYSVVKADLLVAMKDCLHDLENTELLSPEDLDIIDEKRVLRRKIHEMERQCRQSRDHDRREPMM